MSRKSSLARPNASDVPDVGTLRRFYGFGWERRWLARLDRHGIPGDAGYKLRLRSTIALIRPRRPDFRVLDIGCGVGIYAVQIARRFPRATLVGIDLSPAHVEAATVLAERLGVADRVAFRIGDAAALDVSATADVVLAAEIIEHLPEPRQLVDRLGALAGPAGQIIVSVPQRLPHEPDARVYHRRPCGGNYDSIERVDRADLGEGTEVFTYYHRHYSAVELDGLLEGAGLVIRRRRACFWQRPVSPPAFPWRGVDFLHRRLALAVLDRLLLRWHGPQYAETLLRDCGLRETSA